MSEETGEIGHHCGIGFIRLLKEESYYLEKYQDPDLLLNLMYPLLLRQRNRGQDAAGIATAYIPFQERHEKEYLFTDKMMSKDSVVDLYEKLMKRDAHTGFRLADERKGQLMLGHVLYSTALAEPDPKYIHPFERKHHAPTKRIAVAMNGNFANNPEQRKHLRQIGQAPTSKSDMEALAELFGYHLSKWHYEMSHKGMSVQEISKSLDLCSIMKEIYPKLKGAYVIEGVVGNGDAFVARDPHGIRPAYFAKTEEFVVAASEMSAIYATFLNYNIRPENIEELEPGHILTVKANGEVKIEKYAEKTEKKLCMFEAVYFNRLNNKDTYNMRKKLGANIAQMLKRKLGSLQNLCVSYVPHTSISAAYGLHEELLKIETHDKAHALHEKMQHQKLSAQEIEAHLTSDIRFEKALTKDLKIRTFILDKKNRGKLVLNAYDAVYDAALKFEGRKVIIIDDSIVRGTTLETNVIRTLIAAKAKEIYIVSSCPQLRYPCPYGIEMSTLKNFIAFRASIRVIEDKGLVDQLSLIEEKARITQEKIASDVHYVPENHVKEIYDLVTHEEVEVKIAEMLKPKNWEGKLEVIYPSVGALIQTQDPSGNLDTACLDGSYPEEGGLRVLNTALIHYFNQQEEIAYS